MLEGIFRHYGLMSIAPKIFFSDCCFTTCVVWIVRYPGNIAFVVAEYPLDIEYVICCPSIQTSLPGSHVNAQLPKKGRIAFIPAG
jgi:hypothetical protein